MARVHTPLQQFKEARQIAAENNMFISEKGGTYSLYRKTPVRPVWLGSRKDVGEFRRLVERCVGNRAK